MEEWLREFNYHKTIFTDCRKHRRLNSLELSNNRVLVGWGRRFNAMLFIIFDDLKCIP